jgi:hypothetical protein
MNEADLRKAAEALAKALFREIKPADLISKEIKHGARRSTSRRWPSRWRIEQADH